MTTLTLARPRSLPLRAGFLESLLGSLDRALARRRAYVETRRELNWLSDRELADLGIMRCDVDRIAREAAAAI